MSSHPRHGGQEVQSRYLGYNKKGARSPFFYWYLCGSTPHPLAPSPEREGE